MTSHQFRFYQAPSNTLMMVMYSAPEMPVNLKIDVDCMRGNVWFLYEEMKWSINPK
jgi:hypothetical protein